LYIVPSLVQIVHGNTKLYKADDRVGMLKDNYNENFTFSNQMTNLIENVYLKRKEKFIFIRLNEQLVKDAISDPKSLKTLALAIIHEIYAHAMNVKGADKKPNAAKEHQEFFNAPTLIVFSPSYDEIKPNSKAGEFKQTIENTYNQVNKKT
jgi:hypothetical protein